MQDRPESFPAFRISFCRRMIPENEFNEITGNNS